MAKKPEAIEFAEVKKFATALSECATSLQDIMDMASKKIEGTVAFEPPVLMSTNFRSAVRGLDYIDKFVAGIAAQVVQGDKSPLDALRETYLRSAIEEEMFEAAKGSEDPKNYVIDDSPDKPKRKAKKRGGKKA